MLAQFENGNSDDLARVANRMLADSEYRQSLAEKGLKRAWLYDWGRVTKEIVDVYHSVRVPGDKVTEDLRGQFGGRLARRDGWREMGDRVTEAVSSAERRPPSGEPSVSITDGSVSSGEEGTRDGSMEGGS